MIIVRHPGATTTPGQQQQQQQQQMLVVSTNSPQQQQQLQLLQQQQQQNSIRLAAASRVASPATVRQTAPGMGGQFMSPPAPPPPRNPLHTTLSGPVLSTSNHSMEGQGPGGVASTQPPGGSAGGYGLNLDLTGLGGTQLGRADGDVTPLTPQDQLSRYVDQL